MKIRAAFVIGILILACTISGCGRKTQPVSCAYNMVFNDNTLTDSIVAFAKGFSSDVAVIPVDMPNSEDSFWINGESALLININSSEVLFSKNPHLMQYPASTTKVMTAMVALDNKKEDLHIMGEEIDIKVENAVVCDYRKGDIVPFDIILHGALLRSGNDAAAALAMCAADSIDDFCKMMNDKALQLGATHTHYVNPNGLFESEQVITPYDLYLIFNEAIKNKTYVKTISRKSYQNVFKRITPYKEYKINAEYISTNPFFLGDAVAPGHVNIIGGNSGYTSEAGRHYVILCESAGEQYIALVMNTASRTELNMDLEYLLSLIPNNETSDDQTEGAE